MINEIIKTESRQSNCICEATKQFCSGNNSEEIERFVMEREIKQIVEDDSVKETRGQPINGALKQAITR